MSRYTKLFLILGLACLIKDIYPKFDPQLTCTYWNADFNFTTFKWNTSMSSREFQESYCPLRCFNGTLVSIHNLDSKCPRLNCFDCSCKRPECEHYGICCPDISVRYHQLPRVESSFSQELDLFYINNKQLMTEMPQDINSHMTASPPSDRKSPKLGCQVAEGGKSFLYIRSCPSDVSGEMDSIRLCEEDVPTSEVTIGDYAWAIDYHTNVVYRNVYCAKCNGAVKPFQVPLKFSCPDYMPMYDVTDSNEMLRLALNSSSCCGVKKDLPYDVRTFACDGEQFDTSVVSSCDDRHPSRAYDTDVIKACADLNETYHRVFSRFNQKYYTNIFCAICDTNSYPEYSGNGTCQCLTDNGHSGMPPFSMLINFGRSSSVETKVTTLKFVDEPLSCSTTEWPSPDGSCLPLKCSPGKLLAIGNCSSAIAEINGLKYSLKLWLRPDFNESFLSANMTLSDLRQNLRQKIKETVEMISDEYSLHSGCLHDIRTDRQTKNSFTEQIMICWLYGDIVARGGIPRDVFESQVINDLLSGEIGVEIGQDNLIFFRPLVIAGKFEDCQEIGRGFAFACEMNEPLIATVNNWFLACPLPSRRAINFTGLLDCPYVSFSSSYYNITIDKSKVIPSVTVTVDLNGTTLIISDWADLNRLEVDEGDILNICHQVLDSRLQPMVRYRRRYLTEVTNEMEAVIFAQYVTTLVCLACSMICLVLSLVTYLRFPVLQTSAGQNNVCLCLSLLLAQATLIAASQRPRPIGLCKAVGLLTHFLWLWMFSWTFICSFHMFRVFTAKTRNPAFSERDGRKQLMKRIVCSLMCPVIIVVSVIVGSLISSDGETIGYGLDNCYLDSVLLIGVSMIAPLTAIIICNMAFFTVTVCTVHNIRKLQSPEGMKKDDLNQIFVYTKLSSITGACWVTTIIAEAVDVDVFRFISIFLNGFQGVFIFLSYICNKRVLILYMPRMEQFKRSSAYSRSQTNSTVVTSVPQSAQTNSTVVTSVPQSAQTNSTVVTSVPPSSQLKETDIHKSYPLDDGSHSTKYEEEA